MYYNWRLFKTLNFDIMIMNEGKIPGNLQTRHNKTVWTNTSSKIPMGFLESLIVNQQIVLNYLQGSKMFLENHFQTYIPNARKVLKLSLCAFQTIR